MAPRRLEPSVCRTNSLRSLIFTSSVSSISLMLSSLMYTVSMPFVPNSTNCDSSTFSMLFSISLPLTWLSPFVSSSFSRRIWITGL